MVETVRMGFAGGFGGGLLRKQGRKVTVVRMGETMGVEEREVSRIARTKEKRDLSKLAVPAFDRKLGEEGIERLTRRSTRTLQINIGLTCNQACTHCHVESSPSRKETMPKTVADRLVKLTRDSNDVALVDITGGAPEMHEQFKPLVKQFRSMGLTVMDRCNLTILEELDGEAEWLAQNRVKIVASLPCYTAENVEAQRGDGVFDSSIRALRSLNAFGYGVPGSGLELSLVYNPGGAFLPPPQAKLEEDYRRELKRAFGIQFTNLIAIANMPIKRFADDLRRQDKLLEYLELLVDKFNPRTIDGLMCVNQVHVAWDGQLYDCDFNYALEMPIPLTDAQKKDRPEFLPKGLTVFDIESWSELDHARIVTAKHCYGCTAGSGSSCGGALE